MVSLRNKIYTHCRADLMKLVKDTFGIIDWAAFYKSCDGCERFEAEDYELHGSISRDYRLPVGGDHFDAESNQRVPLWAWIPKPPPIIEFFDSLAFQKRYLFWIGRSEGNCIYCDAERKQLQFYEVDQPCWYCHKKETTEDAMEGAEYFIETLKETIKDEKRNERKRKRLASAEAPQQVTGT